LTRAIEAAQVPGDLPRLAKVLINSSALFMLLLASSAFGCSVAPYMVPPFMQETVVALSPLHIADSYGLFAVMTRQRPEIVFEGSRDGTNWLPYEFKIKPGDDLKRPPPWVAPHMPRLDWRLWFAAMNSADRSPWVLELVRRMLENRPEIQIFFEKNPFAGEGPKFIRAYVWDYHFTDERTRQSTGQWWWRDNKQPYLPPLFLLNGKLAVQSQSDKGQSFTIEP
jgi:lipase maturation factor 1